jgi:hypothetical protein
MNWVALLLPFCFLLTFGIPKAAWVLAHSRPVEGDFWICLGMIIAWGYGTSYCLRSMLS